VEDHGDTVAVHGEPVGDDDRLAFCTAEAEVRLDEDVGGHEVLLDVLVSDMQTLHGRYDMRNPLPLRIPRPWVFAVVSRVAGGDVAARRLGVEVGSGCRIYSCRVASEYSMVTIGNDTTVSVDVLFVTHDGTGWLYRDERGRRYRYAPVTVGDRCFIGARATLMPGVRIGSDSVVAAGSVVTKSVPAGSIVGGVPAKVIGRTSDLMAKIATWPAEDDKRGRTAFERIASIAEGHQPLG
jgi:acetyltransferase-like isoleucine patch superfamily enzyme